MRYTTAFLLSLLACSAFASEHVGDFALLDHTGKFHQLSYYGDHKAVVFVTHSNKSSHAQTAAKQAAAASSADASILTLLLNPYAQESRADNAATAASQGHGLPVLRDESQLVTQSLGLNNIAQAIIINPQDMSVRYRGPVTENFAQTLQAALIGNASTAEGELGEAIAFTKPANADVSYTKDIAPILENNCVSCHHDGGIAPWSMSQHAMVRGWAPMMREVVMTRRMPPGQIDAHLSKSIVDVNGLSNEEKQKLVRWIDAGAPKDGTVDPLAELTFDNPKYALGEPDMVFKVPAQSIPATGVLDYRYVPVQLDLGRDVWVRGMEFIPGDSQVLHHVIAYVSSPADKTVRGRETGAARGESIGGFAPGRQPEQFRDNSGRLLKKGSSLLLQMHYTTSGKETVDETEVALYLYDEPPQYVMSGGVAGQRRFLVPPFEKEYKLEGVQEIERDAYLYSLNPHMHYRGKYMSYIAEYPDGTSESLLSVPKYDFNWQFNYELEKPVFLPAGTRLVARGAMDNSDRNPGNPDPSKPVHFGLQTMHEMFFGFTTLRYVGDTPANLAGGKKSEKGQSAGR